MKKKVKSFDLRQEMMNEWKKNETLPLLRSSTDTAFAVIEKKLNELIEAYNNLIKK